MSHLLSRPVIAVPAVVAVAFGFLLAPVFAIDATADDANDPTAIRWSVTPATEQGPDDRTSVENTLDPGETVDDFFAVRNVSTEEVTFSLTAADGFYTRTGRFDILSSDKESIAAGTWISLPETVTVGAGETVVVPFAITAPELAEPGDHAAGVTASVSSVQENDEGDSVGVESRVGFRVTTRVSGELNPSLAVKALAGTYALSWNPFRPGDMTVSFDVANEGNTTLLARGVVDSGGQRVSFPAEGEKAQELLPGDTRTISTVVKDVWPLFAVITSATVSATVVALGGETSTLAPVAADTIEWAVPWPQLLVLIGVALMIFTLVWGRIRSRRALAALVADAREQGRREAQGSEGVL